MLIKFLHQLFLLFSSNKDVLAQYILKLALMQADMSSTIPSLKAAVALQLSKQITAKLSNFIIEQWPAVFACHSHYHAPHLYSTCFNLGVSSL